MNSRQIGVLGRKGKGSAPASSRCVALPALLAVLAISCGDGPLPPGPDDGTDDGPQTTGEPSEPADVALSASCAAAPPLSAGRWVADFSSSVGNLGTLCGTQGPELFGSVTMGLRADLIARVGGAAGPLRLALTAPVCIDIDDPTYCDALGNDVVLHDLAAGTQVLARVGSDLGEPAWLELELRAVLAPGEVCEPESRGRCESTTVCEQDPDRGGPKMCRAIAGDSCSRPLDASLDLSQGGGGEALPFDPAIGDEHAHECLPAGAELVVRLDLVNGESIADDARLDLTVHSGDNSASVGLAVRAPGCDTSEEVACSAAEGPSATIQVDDLGLRASRGEPIYLFVEFAGAQPPQGLRTVDLQWSVVDSP